MALVRNGIVKMDWNADGFLESRKDGFISAVKDYNGIGVAFKEGKAYTLVSEEGEKYTFQEVVEEIKRAYKKKDGDFPEFYDTYVEIYDGREFSNTEALGIQEFEEDILNRLKDLEDYWAYEEETMLQ